MKIQTAILTQKNILKYASQIFYNVNVPDSWVLSLAFSETDPDAPKIVADLYKKIGIPVKYIEAGYKDGQSIYVFWIQNKPTDVVDFIGSNYPLA